MMQRLVFSTLMMVLIFFYLFTLVVTGQPKKHEPWKLDGVEDRIEEIRKGPVTLQFVAADGTPPAEEILVAIDLKKHEFYFGIGMTQSWSLFAQPGFQRYRNQIGDLFNFVTLGFY